MNDERLRTCIRAEFATGELKAEGLIRNVSEGGLFVGTESIPEVGDAVEVRVRGRRGDGVRISGLVWWTTRNAGGTRFGRQRGFGVRLLDDRQDPRSLAERH